MMNLKKLILNLLIVGQIITPAFNCLMAKEPDKNEADLDEDIVRPNVEYSAQDLRDPFLSLLEKVQQQSKTSAEKKPEVKKEEVRIVQAPELSIQGIVWQGSVAQAIVNNQIVTIGDTIGDGAIISDIKKEGIEVDYQGSKFFYDSAVLNRLSNEGFIPKRRD